MTQRSIRPALPHRAVAAACALACLPLTFSLSALAQTQPAPSSRPTITITGTLPNALEAVPGSSNVVGTKQLEAERPFTVREALQGVPGVHVVGEDAFGLNLNIGLRGLDPRRSSRTLLLEDGMPIQLAPYADPTTHYHTPMERVSRIEVLKGSGQIIHGPQTVGGVINFITRAVPKNGLAGDADLSLGNRSFRRVSANVGSGNETFGWLLSASRKQGDGARIGQEHRATDLHAKVELQLNAQHALRAKLGWFEEDSGFSEGGLDQARFDRNPFANPFRNDRFELERTAVQLVHSWTPSPDMRLATQLYWHKVDRASYRQLDSVAEFEGVEVEDDGTLVAEIELGSLRSRAPDSGPRLADCRINGAAITYGVPNGWEERASRCGNQMRPRTYTVTGIEPRLELAHSLFGLRSELIAGLRLHQEDVVRRRFNGITPTARENSEGTFFRDQFDIGTDATAAYLQNTFYGQQWTITPGLRYESYRLRNTVVLAREDRPNNNGRSVSTRTSELLPGIGVTWFGIPGTTVFAGIHRGIAPPRPDANLSPLDDDFRQVDPEISTNLELGVRSSPAKGVQVEATLFEIDFKNQIVPGYSVGAAQTFSNAGKSLHRGLEIAGRVDFGALQGSPHNPYLSASWTHLNTASFKSRLLVPSFEPGETETEDFVDANGRRLPYAPKNLISLSLGFEHAAGWDLRLGLTHVSEQFSDALNTVVADPTGQSGRIPAYTLLNAAVNYTVQPLGATFYLSVANLTDKTYLVSRVNGAFAGMPRQVVAGARVKF
jgi:Fe(3+) dicitrate transport protein